MVLNIVGMIIKIAVNVLMIIKITVALVDDHDNYNCYDILN